MVDPRELTRLLKQLQRVSSPLERMKMVTRAWRSLRRLDPEQRRALADQVGVADAADLIEKLAVGKGGLNPSMVQRALESVGDRNVGDLRKLVSGLRDPEQREELLRRGLEAVSDSLAGPETDEIPVEEVVVEASGLPVPPETDELPVEEVAAQAPTPPSGPETDEIPVEVTAATATAAATVGREKKPEPRTRPKEGRAAPRAAEPVPSEPPAVPRPKTPASARPAASSASRGDSRPRPAVMPPPKPRLPEPTGDDRPPLLDRIGEERILARRFRRFREHLDDARGMNARQLRDLLGLFPDGWARRRVLDMLLRKGIPESLNKAIFLIEQLDSPVARRWCVKTLLHERQLSDDERKLLLERHDLARINFPPGD
jgi:hypothetical protein